MSSERFDAIRYDDLNCISSLWASFEDNGFVTAFQTRAWISAIQETLAKEEKAAVFVVEVRERESARPLMLLPFCRRQRHGLSLIEFVSLGVCDLAMPVMAADDLVLGKAEAQSLWRAVLAVLPRADLVKIQQIPPEYRGRQNPLALLPDIVPGTQQRYETTLEAGSLRVVETKASTKMRQNLKRSERRLSDQGKIEFLAAQSEPQVEMVLAAMFRQRQERFLELGRYDFLAQPEVRDFYRLVARQHLAGNGTARLWALLVNGEPVATCLGLVHAKTLHCLVLTMNGGPWEKSSPALVLISRLLVWCSENAVTLIDFSVGEGYHKTGFGGKPHMLFDYKAGLTVKGMAAIAGVSLVARGKAWVKKHPELFQAARRAIQRVRRLINQRRGQVAPAED